MNGEYIKKMELSELHTRLAKYLEMYQEEFYQSVFSKQSYEFNEKILRELQTRMKRFDEFIELTHFFYGDPKLAPELLVNPKMKIESQADAIASLRFILPYLEHADYTDLESLKVPILEAISLS
jgi:hypothetical protein